MNIFTHIMMFGWIPLVVFFFLKFPPRRAAIISFIFAWLFLPMAAYPIPGLPDYTKMSATCCGVFIGAAIFDTNRLISFSLRPVDIPMAIWCLCPVASSLSNGLGLYDGLSSALAQTVTWGFPYIIGRIYLCDLEGLKEFALGIFIGGIIYMPFCWYEIRMSPQLHNIIYGFMQNTFAATMRFGGWRPMVFMQHGIAVGMWMVSASLVGVYLLIANVKKKIFGIPIYYFVILLTITSILCKSTGSIFLLIAGLITLFVTYKKKTKVLFICLLLVPVVYLSIRTTGHWDGKNLADYIYRNFNSERGLSLWTRFDNENMLSQKALERPVFGWGGWGRSRIVDEEGNDRSITDSLWIIVLGTNGLVGLTTLTVSILLPGVTIIRRYEIKDWFHPSTISAVVLSTLLLLYMIDCLVNAMINPIFMVANGGITALVKEHFKETDKSMETVDKSCIIPVYHPRFL